MGDMADEYKAYKDHKKDEKQKRSEDIGDYLDSLDDVSIECHVGQDNRHIIYFNSGKRLQVWTTTAKFNVIGTDKYEGGFGKMKKKIEQMKKE